MELVAPILFYRPILHPSFVTQLTGRTFRSDRLSLPTTARMTTRGLLFGLAYGGMQDAVGWIRGRPIGYVDALQRWVGLSGSSREQEAGIIQPPR